MKKKKKSRPAGDTDGEDAGATRADQEKRGAYLFVGVGLAVVLLVAAAIYLLRGKADPPARPGGDPPVVAPDKEKIDDGPKKDGPPVKPPDKDKERPKDGDKEKPPEKAKLPALYRPPAGRTVRQMRDEVEEPWSAAEVAPAEVALVRRVGGAGYHKSLAEAVAALPAGKAGAVEIHDNGPLHETPAASEGRPLAVRAGKGFRPLVIWDVPATMKGQADAKAALTFLACKGSLSVEGIDFGLRWPDGLANPATLFRVEGGDLRLTACTFSAAGRPRTPITVAALTSSKDGARCRLTRCLARGQGLAGLVVAAPAAEVLIDGCLLAGQGPMLTLRTAEKPTRLRLVRSTLTSASRLIELSPLGDARRPGLQVLAWDSLLSRTGGAGGEMLTVTGDAAGVAWSAAAALYAGWGQLMAGAKAAGTLEEWRKLWPLSDGDHLHRDPWPGLSADEPATRPAADFLPAGAVAFGATVAPDRALGCDLAALPAARDGWLGVALEPTHVGPEPPASLDAPEIPRPGDGKFHGARVDMGETNLGQYLDKMQMNGGQLGQRVVMHLFGKGEKETSPIRVKGSTLVLHFAPPADGKSPPLAIKAGFSATAAPLIDVEGGGLEVIGGAIRCPDSPGIKLTHLVRVRGGDVRMFQTRLEGPRLSAPEGYKAALAVEGSGDTTGPDKARVVALNECVVASGLGCVECDGPGVWLLLRHCVVLAGGEAITLRPGDRCGGRANVRVSLENVTVAARRAVLRLGDGAEGDVPTLPVQVRSRDCAFLNPFVGKPNRAGLLSYEGDALSRGLLVWQGERDAFDPRMHFGAAPAGDAPEAKEPRAAWNRLWGSAGRLSPRADVTGTLGSFLPKTWPLEALILPGRDTAGAALGRLGITKKRP